MKLLSLLLLLGIANFVFAQATRFDMRDAVHRNTLILISQAPLQKTVGVSHYASGWLKIDPTKLSTAVEGQFDLDLRAIETGDAARDLEWQKTLLNTAQFPIATVFVNSATFKKTALGSGKSVEGDAAVTLQWRGIRQTLNIPLTLSYFRESPETQSRLPGNLLRVSADFTLDLAQFQIAFPKADSLIYSKTVEVIFDAVGTDKPPMGLLPLPAEPKPRT